MRTRFLRASCVVCAALIVLVTVGGCTAQYRKSRHLNKAARYYAAGEYDKAELEYFNVLRLDSGNGDAYAGLGTLYFEQSKMSRMFGYLNKARSVQPNNVKVRTKLATLYLNAGRRKDARDEAALVLQRDPGNLDAPIILAQASATAAEIAEARSWLQRLPTAAAQRAPAIIAEGLLQLRSGNVAAAGRELEKACFVEPKSSAAHLALAAFCRGQRDMTRAEQEFATAAELAPVRGSARLQYAQFEIQNGHVDVAKRTLDEMMAKAPDCIPPYIVRAGIAASEKKFDQSLTLLGKALAADPANPEAVLLSAQVRVAKGDFTAAVAELERATKTYPSAAQLFFQLGVTSIAAGDLPKAAAALLDALKLQPELPPASLALGDVYARQGNLKSAVAVLAKLIVAHPEMANARLALANAYSRLGDFKSALGLYQKLRTDFPRDAEMAELCGRTLVQMNRVDEARAAFLDALKLRPDFYPALEGVTMLDLQRQRIDDATARLKAEIQRTPSGTGPYLLLAKIHLAKGQLSDAEHVLQQLVQVSPNDPAGYMMLAQVYTRTKQEERAIENLNAAYAHDPKNPEPLMMIAVLRHQQGKYAEARSYYERVIQIKPTSGAALNNLAYLYAEQLHDLNRAFDLAQQARACAPDDPHAADTLGWIAYRRGQYQWALSLFSEAAERTPSDPDFQYHLGMAYYMVGNEAAARTALSHAVANGEPEGDSKAAQQALFVLGIDPATADPKTMRAVEETAVKNRDPIAYTRLGAWRLANHDQAGAIVALQAALGISPSDVTAASALIHAYRLAGKSRDAMDLAKSTRKLAPTDPHIAETLGELAFEAGDYRWAFSLLQEARQALPDDPATAYAFAEAAYRRGRVSLAREAVADALSAQATFPKAPAARRLSSLLVLETNPTTADADKQITAALADAPSYPPALMALGALKEKQGDRPAAIQAYTKILNELPEFAPAQRKLALLLVEKPENDGKVVELAAAARATFPDDPELAKALGVALARRGEYARAVPILGRVESSHGEDPVILYYLGLSQTRMKNRAAGRDLLHRALSLNLPPDLATKARALLADVR